VTNASLTPIERLAALQELDRDLRRKAEALRNAEAEIAELEAQVARRREAVQQCRAERDTADARRQELESALEAEEAKMTDRRMRLNRVRNEKELQALRREIELGKEANRQAEEQILGIFEALDGFTAAVADAEQQLADLESAAAAKTQEHQGLLERLRAEVATDRARRDQVAADVDAGLRGRYEQLLERRGGSAVVEVRNGICQGCFMNIPPQLYNELQRSRDVRACPNCHRMLLWRPTERLEPAPVSR